VAVNGQDVQELDLDRIAQREKVLPGVKRASGRIGLQQHSGEVRFRDVQIKDLSPQQARKADVAFRAAPGEGRPSERLLHPEIQLQDDSFPGYANQQRVQRTGPCTTSPSTACPG